MVDVRVPAFLRGPLAEIDWFGIRGCHCQKLLQVQIALLVRMYRSHVCVKSTMGGMYHGVQCWAKVTPLGHHRAWFAVAGANALPAVSVQLAMPLFKPTWRGSWRWQIQGLMMGNGNTLTPT